VGALFSFEVARHLRRENGKVPAHLFIGALDAPQLPYPHSSIAELSDSEFIEKTSLFDFPESVRQNSELMRLLLPTLKTAILIRENYTHTKSEPLDCPISVFGGMQDKLVPQEHLSAWCEQTRSTFKLQMLPGNHLFLHGDQELLLQALSHELASLVIAPQK
jgi:medium-chain acyl-[acyl-carrier-protein] hydrolase